MCNNKRFLAFLGFILLSLPAFATKEVIVLTASKNGTQVCYQVAYWYPISSGAVAQTNGSAWSGASTAENTAIQNGSIQEEIGSQCFAIGTAAATMEGVLLQNWIARNAQIGGIGAGQYLGIYYDSSAGWQ